MGTNYYRIKHIDENTRKEINNYIDNSNIKGLRYYIIEIENEFETHICKTSFGWQTLFDHNWGKYYEPTKESLKQFLKEPNTHIENEYGDIISYDEFWKIVNGHNINPKNYYTSEVYSQENKYERDYCDEYRQKCKEKFGVITSHSDFMNGGLRWAVFSDFS